MSRGMSNMRGVDQRNQYVHVEQELRGSSSRNAFTISDVTITPALRTGSSGTPLRSLSAAGGRREERANSDTTSSMVLLVCCAIALAAVSTSSSMVNAVRILNPMNIKHHASCIKRHGKTIALAAVSVTVDL